MINLPQSVKTQKQALHDLMGTILVGPPAFPIKQPTASALFDLALDRLAHHDKTMAEALRRFASQFARLELLELTSSTLGLPSADVDLAKLRWWLNEPLTYSSDDWRDNFDKYRRTVGKKTCHVRTLRRQYELLCAYGKAHRYPAGANSKVTQRSVWGHEHLSAMILEAQVVSCWHPQPNLTEQERDKLLQGIDKVTSLAQLSALVLAHLHSTTTDYLLKRLLPRRRR
jgi:hypothetical protein